MLIDYLEENTGYLRNKEKRRISLERQLKSFYSRDIKEEVIRVKKEISKKKNEVVRNFYENIEEYVLLQKHFPQLLEEYFSDPYIGKILSKKKWLLEFKPLKEKDAEKKLEKIRKQRKEVRDALDFLKKWVGKVDKKSFVATWKSLKDVIKDGVDKDELQTALKEHNLKLKKEGWKILINDSLILIPLKKLISQVVSQRNEEKDKLKSAEGKKGAGTVKEYESLSELRKVNRSRMKTERMIRHLLISNRSFLKTLRKKPVAGGSYAEKTLNEIAGTVYLKKVDEKKWLKEMKKKLS